MKIRVDSDDAEFEAGAEIIALAENPDVYISIGIGNRKIGMIPSWSVTPKVTCNPRVLQFCGKHCYNNKTKDIYPGTFAAWSHNFEMARTRPETTEFLINKYLAVAVPGVMRLHVAGDFFSKEYLEMWKRIAVRNDHTVFYTYSKVDWLDHSKLPENLRVLRSMWPKMSPPRQRHVMRNCWVQDGTEKRIPSTAVLCCGDCPKCGFKCAFGDTDIIINLHR